MTKPVSLAVFVGLLAAALAFWLWPSDEPAVLAPGGAAVASASGTRVMPAPGRPGAAPWAVTVTDAMGLTLDAARLFQLGYAGGLVIDRDTRSAIEAVLNSMPEEPSEQDLQRLERTLREGLPKEDAEKALKLFNDYRAYTGEVRNEMMPKGIPANQQEASAFFDQMDAVRRRHFDEATALALFGPYDGYARIAMEASFVEQDATLTPQQKKERVDALRAKLPPDQQAIIPQPSPDAASQPAS